VALEEEMHNKEIQLEVQEVLAAEQLAKELMDKQELQTQAAVAELVVAVGQLLLVLEDQVLLLFEELQRVHQELQVVVNPLVVQTLFTYLTRRGRIKHNGTFR
jgi:hypothetical protein